MKLASVYVAASSSDLERAERWTKALNALGIQTTNTWIEEVKQHGGGNPNGASETDRKRWANQDLKGVEDADILWCLLPSPGTFSHGAFFELGFAYAQGRQVVTSGQLDPHSIFLSLTEHSQEDLLGFCQVIKRSGLIGLDSKSTTANGETIITSARATPATLRVRSTAQAAGEVGD